jgi:acetyl-CoA synthetase
MGKPTPGFDIEVLEPNEAMPVERGKVGELAIRNTGKPSPTVGYLNLPDQSNEMFEGEWMRSGDLVRVDDDGYFWHEGRADNVIISSGYRIGPTEVEDSLMQHDAVAEAAVVGVPDEKRGEIIAGHVRLSDEQNPSPELADEIKQYVRTHLSKHEYPQRIEFVSEFPRTESGKIKRKDL